MFRRSLALAGVVVLVTAGAAAAKPPEPRFEGFPKREQKRVLQRISDAPAPYKRLLRATYERLKIRALFEYNASYVSVKERAGGKRYVVYLDILTRKGGAYGNHLTLHELGHVIHHEWFDAADFTRFFDLFRQSPNWRECFETAPDYPIPCDDQTEILADQLAFYATGDLGFRSSYDIPPLFSDPAAMTAAIQAGGA